MGFLKPYFADLAKPVHADRYERWLDAHYHGEMSYLERGLEVRREPTLRVPEARSVMVLRVPYHHQPPPDPGGFTGKVARYAWGRDYHNLIGKRLKSAP